MERRLERFALIGLGLICTVCIALHFNQLDSILYGNTSKWLGEALRASRGEMPYRDFSWPYPPFALFLEAVAFRVFGASFLTATILTDAISLAVVALSYRLLRRLVNWRFAALLTSSVLMIYGVEGNIEPLFSLQLYSPAILTGSLGLLLVLLGTLRLQPSVAVTAVGAFIALLSKPEFAAATIAALVLLSLTQWRGTQSMILLSAAIAPAAVIYALVLAGLGPRDVLLCLSGLGLTKISCPLWPTGLGIFSIVTALTCSIFLILPALAICVFIKKRNPGIQPRPLTLWLLLASVTLVKYLPWYFTDMANVTRNIYLTWFFNTNSLFTLIVWPLGAGLAWLVFQWIRDPRSANTQLMILCAVPFAMQMRSVFATILFVPRPVTETPVAACLFAMLCGSLVLAALLHRLFPSVVSTVEAERATALSAVILAVIIATGSAWIHHRKPAFAEVSTPAGTVQVRDAVDTAAVVNFVMAHTGPNDSIQEIPLGGGVSFVTGRIARAYTTQFTSVAPPPYILERDEHVLRAHPPTIVIGRNEPQFGAFYGMNARVRCTYPGLLWMPRTIAGDAGYQFPAIRFLAKNYSVAAASGTYVMLTPTADRRQP